MGTIPTVTPAPAVFLVRLDRTTLLCLVSNRIPHGCGSVVFTTTDGVLRSRQMLRFEPLSASTSAASCSRTTARCSGERHDP